MSDWRTEKGKQERDAGTTIQRHARDVIIREKKLRQRRGMKMVDSLQLVIITGMSGAGKTVAMQSFEDMGYYCVDNMPPSLLPKFWELIHETGKETKIALVMDLRAGDFFEDIQSSLELLQNTSYITTRIVYLDANDEELVSRYKETRRSHPLAPEGRLTEGIQRERDLLKEIRLRAQLVLDTTDLTPRQLRERIIDEFHGLDNPLFRVQLVSFGFKYGNPIDADIVMDVRFLPNPHYIDELRPLTGMDEEVYDYVMRQPEMRLNKQTNLTLTDIGINTHTISLKLVVKQSVYQRDKWVIQK